MSSLKPEYKKVVSPCAILYSLRLQPHIFWGTNQKLNTAVFLIISLFILSINKLKG